MKYSWIIILFPFFSQAQVLKSYFGVGDIEGQVVISDSTFDVRVNDWIDPFEEGFFPDSIAVNYEIVDAKGNMYLVDSVWSANKIRARLTLRCKDSTCTVPAARSVLYKPLSNGQIPVAPIGFDGLTNDLLSRIHTHNANIGSRLTTFYTKVWSNLSADSLYVSFGLPTSQNDSIINSKLELFRGGVRIFYPSQYTITNDTIIPNVIPFTNEKIFIKRRL